MPDHSRRLVIVVSAQVAAAANARAKELDTEAGERTFTVGLSPTGNLPATHYWCSWQMTPEFDDGLKARLQQMVSLNRARIFNGSVRTPESILTELGLMAIASAPPR